MTVFHLFLFWVIKRTREWFFMDWLDYHCLLPAICYEPRSPFDRHHKIQTLKTRKSERTYFNSGLIFIKKMILICKIEKYFSLSDKSRAWMEQKWYICHKLNDLSPKATIENNTPYKGWYCKYFLSVGNGNSLKQLLSYGFQQIKRRYNYTDATFILRWL